MTTAWPPTTANPPMGSVLAVAVLAVVLAAVQTPTTHVVLRTETQFALLGFAAVLPASAEPPRTTAGPPTALLHSELATLT